MPLMLLLLSTAFTIRSIDGTLLSPFRPAAKANVLFFISSDCPISNSYAPTIQRICRDYEAKGVSCSLFYEDIGINAAAARKHLSEYRYGGIAAAIDETRKIANEARATITPQAVVIDGKGDIRYRGRIDNFYAGIGKPRQVVTSHDVRDALDAILNGRRIANPETEPYGCYITDPSLLRK